MEDIDAELVAHPHDAFFKEVFSDVGRASLFFQEHLPAPLVAQADWTSLELMSGSFVKQTLQQVHSDLLFSVQVEGRPVQLYLLFEHQTTVDQRMPLRLLTYITEILNKHEETHGLPLTPVLSFVLHQGPDRWIVSPCFEDLFALPEGLKEVLLPYLPKFRHLLLDLSQYDPAGEEKDAVNRILLEFMKQIRTRHLLNFFLWLEKQEARTPQDLLRLCLLYMWNTDRGLDPEEFHSKLSDIHLKEEIVTIAAKLKAEGRAEGWAEGEARGKAEGEARGKAEGEARGKLKVLQEIMQLPVSCDEELAGLEAAELERRYEDLHRQYKAQFKRP